MQQANIPIKTLKELMKLSRRKDKLQKKLEKLDAQMVELLADFAPTGMIAPRSAPAVVDAPKATALSSAPAAKAKRVKKSRGSVTENALAALKAAGSEGAKVADLAAKAGTKPANIHAWLASTGKKYVERVGRGAYRLKQQQPEAQPEKAQEIQESPEAQPSQE